MAEYAETGPGEKTKRVKKYEPVDSDYEITNIGISEAENGVVVECRYQLKDSVKEKMRKKSQEMGGHFSSYEYEDTEKSVFQSKPEALKFINDELTAMWSEG